MGPANAFFLYPSSFPFLLPQSLWGRKSVALGGDSACNQRAGKSLSFGLNTPLSLSLSLSLLLHLLASKAIVCTGETSEKGPIAPLPILPVLFARSLFPVPRLGEIDRRGLCPGITHIPDLDQNTKHVFLSHPRHSDDHQRGGVQYQQHHWHFFVGHIESNISKCAIFPKLLALGQVFLKWILGQDPVFPLWILIKPLVYRVVKIKITMFLLHTERHKHFC